MCNPVAAAVMSIGGSLYSGITGMQAAREQAHAARTVSSKWDDLTGWMKPKKGVKRVADWHDGGNALPY